MTNDYFDNLTDREKALITHTIKVFKSFLRHNTDRIDDIQVQENYIMGLYHDVVNNFDKYNDKMELAKLI